MNNEYLSITKAHKEHGYSISALRRWLAEGRLPGYYSGKWFFINVNELEKLINAGEFGGRRMGA